MKTYFDKLLIAAVKSALTKQRKSSLEMFVLLEILKI
jgi:hypothetical protein